MENENEVVVDNVQPDATDYINTIEALKKTTVSKEAYEKILAERKELISKLANGETVNVENPSRPNIEELITTINNPNVKNIDFVKATLELRNQFKETTGEDIFLPQGPLYQKNDNDIASAEKVASVLQSCLDSAEGNDEIFTSLLGSSIVDIPGFRRR